MPFTGAWYANAARQDLVLNTVRAAALSESANLPNMYSMSASASYVTGTHNLKAGMQWLFGRVGYQYSANADLVQLYRAGVPDSVRVYNTPTEYYTDVNANLGLYVQDAITLRRLTVNVGLRFDHLNATVTDVALPAGRFVPARTFGQKDIVDSQGNSLDSLPNFNDFSPRLSATYDLFGDAKTAVKASYNKYMVNWAGGFAQRYNPMTFSNDQRSWRDLNGDDIAQDNEIGPSNNKLFGVAQSRFPAPDLSREYNVEWSVGLQRELMPGVSVLAAWYDRRYKNTEKSLNTLLTLDDYVSFTATSPLDGSPVTIYNLKPEKQGLVKLVDSNSDINQRIYKGYELSFNARLPRGANVFGGITADKNLRISCDTNDPNQLRFCDDTKYDIPFRPDFKLAGNYPMPFGFQVSGIIMSYAGNAQNTNTDGSITTYLRNNWVVPASVFPNGQRTQSVTVNLVEPGSKYGERWNQVDVSVKRAFRRGTFNVTPQLDIYNLFNGNTVLTQNQAYGSALDQPLTILQGRIFRAAVQMKF